MEDMMSISSALRKLRLQQPTQQHIEEIYRQIRIQKNDRGVAILAAILIDNALAYAIYRRMLGRGNYGRLFENEGPISTFDARMLIADALGILGGTTSHNLSTIKH